MTTKTTTDLTIVTITADSKATADGRFEIFQTGSRYSIVLAAEVRDVASAPENHLFRSGLRNLEEVKRNVKQMHRAWYRYHRTDATPFRLRRSYCAACATVHADRRYAPNGPHSVAA